MQKLEQRYISGKKIKYFDSYRLKRKCGRYCPKYKSKYTVRCKKYWDSDTNLTCKDCQLNVCHDLY